ncbi:MAG TPA: HAMP domain-containing sensor histidine kinase [Solirubrobacteraceae bacterium]|nr:HAMP domain-containing sensor histidine kinase [Solirubrobacteraceae bacterium]
MTSLRGHPFGLQGRIVGVVLVTAVATLLIAAVALLGPLEASLRKAEQRTLIHEVITKKTVHSFSTIPLNQVRTSSYWRTQLSRRQQGLGGRVGEAIVSVIGSPVSAGPLLRPRETGDDTYDDAAVAMRTGHDYSFGTIDGREYARVAIRFKDVDGSYYVLAVRKDIQEIPNVVSVVRTAFFDAALAGLGLSLLLGIPLSARLVRRLRRLREAALQMAHDGPGGEVPVDRAHDEVGDLSRTLSVMQQRLRRQEEARRAFVATASHELRTPLTSLDGMLELLNEDLSDEHPDLQDARALVARAHAQSRRLGRLAADLLDLSRIDAQVELRSEPVELVELSRAVLAEFEHGAEQRAVRSTLDDVAGAVWALGDPGSIAQILRILLDNARRASPAGGEVQVVLHRDPVCAISVCDEGPGVPADEREAIFERFHRGKDTGGQAGFGLGLAIGRELAERMGGELALEDRPGPGATFTLRLPAARAPEQEPVAIS